MSVGGVAAAFAAAVASLFITERALAQSEAERQADHFLFFSGADLWRAGGFVHGGVLWSPDGIDREGFTFKLLQGGGYYFYKSGAIEVTGASSLSSVMPGWRFKRDRFDAFVYAGLDVQTHTLFPDDRGNHLRGAFAGVRAGAEFWYEPNDAMMISGAASVSTIGASYWSRGAFGWRLLDRFWAGPEAGFLGGDHYQQMRLGLHVTSFKTGWLEWSAGLGYARDSDHRAGPYAHIGVLTRH